MAQAVDAAVQGGALQGAGEAAGQGGGGDLGEDVIPAALEGGQGFLGAVGDRDGAPFAALGAGGGGADDAQFVLADVGPAQLQGFGAAEAAVGQELPGPAVVAVEVLVLGGSPWAIVCPAQC